MDLTGVAKTRSGHITRLDTTLLELCGFVLRRNNVASVSCHVFVLNTHFIKMTTDIKDKAETKDYFCATYAYTQGPVSSLRACESVSDVSVQ
jgi:hypothetical protein